MICALLLAYLVTWSESSSLLCIKTGVRTFTCLGARGGGAGGGGAWDGGKDCRSRTQLRVWPRRLQRKLKLPVHGGYCS